MQCEQSSCQPTRRSFLQDGSLLLAGAGLAISQPDLLLGNEARGKVRVGMVTDLHYAHKPAAGSRHYRETLTKIAEAGEQFQKAKCKDIAVVIGRLSDHLKDNAGWDAVRAA